MAPVFHVVVCHLGFLLSHLFSALALCADPVHLPTVTISYRFPPGEPTHAARPSSVSASTVAQTSVLPLIGMNCFFLIFLPQHVVPTSLMPFVLHNSWFCLPPPSFSFPLSPNICVCIHIFMYLHTHTHLCVYTLNKDLCECTMLGTV